METSQVARDAFKQLMHKLRGCFPSMRHEDERWSETIQAFHAGLLPYDLDVVVRTFERIVKRGRAGQLKFFPDLPEAIAIAEDELRRHVVDRKALLEEPTDPDPDADSPFREMTDRWEQEDRDDPQGEARSLQRSIEFNKVLAGNGPGSRT